MVYGEAIGRSILFYINPSNNGAIIGPKDVEYIQHTSDETDQQKLIQPCPDRIIIKTTDRKAYHWIQRIGTI